MSAGTKVLTWLTERLEEKDGEAVCGDEAYQLYQDYCKAHKILLPATRPTFDKMVKKLYPYIGFRYLNQKFYYKGLSLAPETFENNTIQLPEFCTIEAVKPLTIAIPTLYVVNNKTVAFSVYFTEQDIKVSILSKDIDLESIGCSSENTPKNLKAFAKCAPRLSLCQGLEWSKELEVPMSTVVEEWRKTDEGTPASKRIRSERCCVVVTLLYFGNICRRCQNYFYSKRNKRQRSVKRVNKEPPIKTEDTQAPIITEDKQRTPRLATKSTQTVTSTVKASPLRKKVSMLIDSVGQHVPDGFKVLLESQLNNSVAKNRQQLRWNSRVVAMCRSVLNTSRRAYLQLCRSGLLVLPSIRSLTRRERVRSIKSKEGNRRGTVKKETKTGAVAGSVSGAAKRVSTRKRSGGARRKVVR